MSAMPYAMEVIQCCLDIKKLDEAFEGIANAYRKASEAEMNLVDQLKMYADSIDVRSFGPSGMTPEEEENYKNSLINSMRRLSGYWKKEGLAHSKAAKDIDQNRNGAKQLLMAVAIKQQKVVDTQDSTVQRSFKKFIRNVTGIKFKSLDPKIIYTFLRNESATNAQEFVRMEREYIKKHVLRITAHHCTRAQAESPECTEKGFPSDYSWLRTNYSSGDPIGADKEEEEKTRLPDMIGPDVGKNVLNNLVVLNRVAMDGNMKNVISLDKYTYARVSAFSIDRFGSTLPVTTTLPSVPNNTALLARGSNALVAPAIDAIKDEMAHKADGSATTSAAEAIAKMSGATENSDDTILSVDMAEGGASTEASPEATATGTVTACGNSNAKPPAAQTPKPTPVPSRFITVRKVRESKADAGQTGEQTKKPDAAANMDGDKKHDFMEYGKARGHRRSSAFSNVSVGPVPSSNSVTPAVSGGSGRAGGVGHGDRSRRRPSGNWECLGRRGRRNIRRWKRLSMIREGVEGVDEVNQ